MVITRCHICETDHDAIAWRGLLYVGMQDPGNGDDPAELRQCDCGNTLGREIVRCASPAAQGRPCEMDLIRPPRCRFCRVPMPRHPSPRSQPTPRREIVRCTICGYTITDANRCCDYSDGGHPAFCRDCCTCREAARK